MICVTLHKGTLEEIYGILQDPYVEMAEVRLDLCTLSDDEYRELFETCDKALIATWRGENWARGTELLRLAIEAGVRYIDLDVAAPAPVSKEFQKLCRHSGTQLIRSWHDFERTPDKDFLDQVVGRCLRYGADIVKVVTTAQSAEDAARVLSLYTQQPEFFKLEPSRLVAFAMGAQGQDSRIECLALGAPFSYACLEEAEAIAPGQMSAEQMHRRIYGEHYGFYRDSLEVPASKSFAQRAILCAALAEGTSHLRGYTVCTDNEAAVKLARQMGAKVTRRGDVLTITGIGPVTEPLSLEKIHTGESGLLTRLAIPLLSHLNGRTFEIEGCGTLPGRPLTGASDIMAAFGVMLSSRDGRDREIAVPLRVRGSLVPGTADIPGGGGSQLISGLLMTLPLCKKPSQLFVSEPKSIPYMFITLDVMHQFGVNVQAELEGDAEMLAQQDWSYCTGINFTTKGNSRYKAADFDLEGDWSSAADWLVAGAVFGAAEVIGVDHSSIQADISILDVLVEAGACVGFEEDEPVASVRKAPLEAFSVDLNNAPDLFPAVSVLAAFCPGVSDIKGVGRLKRKESDRGRAILEMLSAFGVRAQICGDSLQIEGESYASRLLGGRLLHAGKFSSFHDHRMAMALAIASIGADGPVEIDDKACVAKSFPEFFEIFR
ncbi:MAG: type I 3-dehydroquinate dehydratase [Bacteroidales bacterium]|nr:type I 3-dehydroquinate dehydratase [Candidatus Cryptobacteroides aphodequi]